MKRLVRLNDPTSHNGKVITASSTMEINGVKVALKYDLVSCPKHGVNQIVESSMSYLDNDRGAVVELCKTACGAVVYSTQHDVSVDK